MSGNDDRDKNKASAAFGGAACPQGFEYRICGDNTPYIEIRLEPGCEILAEAGTFMSKTPAVGMEMVLGDGRPQQSAAGRFWTAVKRSVSGDSFMLARFNNAAQAFQTLTLAAPTPGEIIAIDLADSDGALICKQGAFMAAPKGTTVDIHLRRKISTGLFGGEGFVMQKVTGGGWAFLSAGGNYALHELKDGEELQVDTGCLLAMTPGVKMDIELIKSVKTILFGGEGLFLARLTGPGKVWVQSMPFRRQVDMIGDALEPRFRHGPSRG